MERVDAEKKGHPWLHVEKRPNRRRETNVEYEAPIVTSDDAVTDLIRNTTCVFLHHQFGESCEHLSQSQLSMQ